VFWFCGLVRCVA